MKMRGFMLMSASSALTIAVTANAWLQKKQFYPTVVYLTKSSPSVAVSINIYLFLDLHNSLRKKALILYYQPVLC